MTSCVRSCQQVFQLVLRDAILSFLQSCRSRNVLVHVSNTIVICCTLGCNDPLWSKVLSCGSRVDLKRNFVDLFFLFDVKLLNVVMYGYVHHGTRGRNHGPILKNQWLLWKVFCTDITLQDCYGRDSSKKVLFKYGWESTHLGVSVAQTNSDPASHENHGRESRRREGVEQA